MITRVGVSSPLFILATCGGEIAKKNFSGTPRTPAKGVALCTPLRGQILAELSRLVLDPAKGVALCTPLRGC